MKQFSIALSAFLIPVLAACCGARADLSGEIDQILNDKLLSRAAVGIDIVRMGKSPADAARVYQINPTLPLVPASNLKVITTSAALEQLGANFRFRTLLLYHDGRTGSRRRRRPDPRRCRTPQKSRLGRRHRLQNLGRRPGQANNSVPPTISWSMTASSTMNSSIPTGPPIKPRSVTSPRSPALNLNANCIDVYVRPAGYGQTRQFLHRPADRLCLHQKQSASSGGENAVWLSREPGTNDLDPPRHRPLRQ